MPLPLGHTALGLITYETGTGDSAFRRWKRFVFIAVLANLPDIDVVIGLMFKWNGNAFHRGPTHSLVFALTAGFLVYFAARRWLGIQGISYRLSAMLILSHVLADALLTDSSVSFFWPLEVYWSQGHAGWTDIVHSIIFEGFKDGWIVLCCGVGIVLIRLARWYLVLPRSLPRPAKTNIE